MPDPPNWEQQHRKDRRDAHGALPVHQDGWGPVPDDIRVTSTIELGLCSRRRQESLADRQVEEERLDTAVANIPPDRLERCRRELARDHNIIISHPQNLARFAMDRSVTLYRCPRCLKYTDDWRQTHMCIP